jgi:ABC-type uncharacterized transport system substrate-binding protein
MLGMMERILNRAKRADLPASPSPGTGLPVNFKVVARKVGVTIPHRRLGVWTG